METTLLVAAEARELAGVLRHCRRRVRLSWPVRFARMAELDGNRLLLVANGAGPRLAGEACDIVAAREKVRVVVSTGFCGALDPALAVGDVFVASRVEAIEEGAAFEAQMPVCARPHASGRLFSIDRVVRTVEEKERLRTLGAAAVEMEAAAVGSRAARWGVPFFCIRAVLDTAGEGFTMDFNAVRCADGRLSTARILRAAMSRPAVLAPELYRLHRRSRLGARAIGDFVAGCRF